MVKYDQMRRLTEIKSLNRQEHFLQADYRKSKVLQADCGVGHGQKQRDRERRY